VFTDEDDPVFIETITYQNDKFFALGTSGGIFYSTDGTSWREASHDAPGYVFHDIACGGGQYVAIGYSGYISVTQSEGAVRSADGINWKRDLYQGAEAPFGTAGYTLTTIAYGAGKFVAGSAGSFGTADTPMYYSADGQNWTRISDTPFTSVSVYGMSNIQPEINDIAWSGTKFIAVGNYGHMAQSTDGVNWTAVSSSIFETGENGDHMVSVATNGSGTWVVGAAYGNIYYSSDNGVSWQKKADASSSSSTTAFAYDVNGVAFGDGRFVAVSGMAEAGYSTDGAAWTKTVPNPLYVSMTTKGDLKGVAFGNNRFVAVGSDRNDVPAVIYASGQ
jgi:hypothetical protein